VATNTEQIQDLNKTVAGLQIRIQDLANLERRLEKVADEAKTHDRDLAALKQSVTNLEKQVDRLIHQRFTIWVALAAAVFGSLLTFGSQLLIRYLTR
jgi:type II secretory pathway component PulM